MKNFASLVFFVVAVACQQPAEKTEEPLPQIHDAHVHLMSPAMVEDWQAMGIPFSRSAANYTALDTILANNGGAPIDLIGMGYVYGNPDDYAGWRQLVNTRKMFDRSSPLIHLRRMRLKNWNAVTPRHLMPGSSFISAPLRCISRSPFIWQR
jgi:hypothetical protein